ncbi:envelope stress response membrane protein PspC [Vibrio sp. HA2012]|uniref:envelope stress response membrane protein PspC n=1 Tax=Vibrio sp. HA2012 TaxID=1971595 RepID=UPI000C2C387F|nr:envelope stress response membrane protein PspC [Vibrio sp. HA2012]PJC88053.1 envelope stress response membrane protein PspC [Vibrio sp. HA2012]
MRDRELYRDPVNGKLAGVCAGIAHYFGIEVWLVRIIVVSVTLLGGNFLVVVAYVAAAMMLEKQPYDYTQTVQAEQWHKLKSKSWQSGKTPAQLLMALDQDLYSLESRVRSMEAYVTSDTFKVNREFNKL